jgi:hypothetical protein
LRHRPGVSERGYPLRVSVIDRHLITVFNKVDGKSVSHMAETDRSDTSDHEFGESGRFTRNGGRSGHEFLAGRKAGDARVSWPIQRLEGAAEYWIIVHRDLRRAACVRAVIDWIKRLFAEQRDVLAGIA